MTIIRMFSEHPRIKDSNGRPFAYWVSDRKLETNIRTLCQSEPNTNAEFWARSFLNTFECEPLALKHMTAYLEKLGYWAANSVHKQLRSFQQCTQLRFEQQDLWQIAWSFSSDPKKFFSNFNTQRPLENYARVKMAGKIRDAIVSLGMERRRGDWALLRHSTRLGLQEALQNQGYRQPQLDCYVLVWNSFNEIYVPQKATNNRALPAPTDEQLQQIANLYNQLVQPSQVAALGTANRMMIEGRLRECIQALRTYQNISLIPFDAQPGGNDDFASLSETIPDPKPDSGWERIENQELVEQLMAVLTQSLGGIDEENDNCLLLRCGFDLDYRSIAPFFGVVHTTIRSRYNRATQQLRKQVAQWAQEKLNVTPDSESINEMKAPLKECLKKYYEGLTFPVFRTSWQQLDRQRRDILHLRYFGQMDEVAIARQLQLTESEVSNGLVTGRQELVAAIREWIQNRLNVRPDLLNPLADKIATLVQRLIANYSAPDFN